jgi:hypothetical protein
LAEFRLSPQSIREFVVPVSEQKKFPAEALAFMKPGKKGPEIYYRESVASKPEIQRHERIHAGQALLGHLPGAESLREVWSKLGDYGPNTFAEQPAYEFMFGASDGREDRQKLLNAFLSMMNRRNANNAEPLEAAMDESMLREFIKRHPAAVAPPKVIK